MFNQVFPETSHEAALSDVIPRSRTGRSIMMTESQSEPVARALLVDDHPIFREGLRSLIGHLDEVVVGAEADTESAAIRLLEAQPFELAIVDLNLGAGSGLRLIRRARKINPRLHILVASMYDESLYGERAIHAGADGYICKQDDPDKLAEAIALVAQGEQYISNKLAQSMVEHQQSGAVAEALDPVDALSERELQIFSLIGSGYSTREIALKLFLSPKTVDAHRDHIKRKVGISSNTRLVHRAVEWVLSQ